jgi:hypothetical protein
MDKAKYDYAKEIKQKAYSKEEDLIEKGPLSAASKRNLSMLFEQAGDAFLSLGDERISKAVSSLYRKAEEYAPYTDVKKRIEKKIEKIETIDNSGLPGLEKIIQNKRLSAFLSIGFLISALFFVSSSLTGNVIAGLDVNNSRFVGICLFACGLIFAFVYSKCKTRNKKKKK